MNAIMSGNLLEDLPATQGDEVFETLLSRPGLEIRRIVSHGHRSPEGFWYDQAEDEWVLLVAGRARLRFDGDEPRELTPGSFVFIPAHQRHRVEETDASGPTVWLAVHFARNATSGPRSPETPCPTEP